MEITLNNSENCPFKKDDWSYGDYYGEICQFTQSECGDYDVKFPENCPLRQGKITVEMKDKS